MRILICGAGVQGSQYAAALHQADQDVTILARGQRLAQIKENGIVLEEITSGQRTAIWVPVVDELKPDDAYDLALVMMRCNQVPNVLPDLAANPRIPNVLFLGNNIRGPGAMVSALGRERVLLGFAGAAGVREGHVVRCPQSRRSATYLGELNGEMTPRLEEIAAVFAGTRFPVTVFPDIQAWLKTHVALIIPLAYGVYMGAGDNYRLAHTRDALVLIVRAVREGFSALRVRGYKITPPYLGRIMRLPEPVLVALLARLFDTQFAEIGLAGHANAARDEMSHLADGLWEVIQSSGLPAPSLRTMLQFGNPKQPPLKEGSQHIPLQTRELWLGLGAAAAGLALLTGFAAWLKKYRR